MQARGDGRHEFLRVTGYGGSDWDGSVGRIERFDLGKGTRKLGAAISTFWYAAASPSGRFVVFEHGSDENNNVDVYDVARDRSHAVARWPAFTRAFGRRTQTDEAPIGWVDGRDRLLADVWIGDDHKWLVLLDVHARTIVWKAKVTDSVWPYSYQQLDATRGLIRMMNDDRIYVLSLADGNLRPLSDLRADAFSLSPNRVTIALIHGDALIFATAWGAVLKSISLGGMEHQTAYKAMGTRAPLWGSDGRSVLVFGAGRARIVAPPSASTAPAEVPVNDEEAHGLKSSTPEASQGPQFPTLFRLALPARDVSSARVPWEHQPRLQEINLMTAVSNSRSFQLYSQETPRGRHSTESGSERRGPERDTEAAGPPTDTRYRER